MSQGEEGKVTLASVDSNGGDEARVDVASQDRPRCPVCFSSTELYSVVCVRTVRVEGGAGDCSLHPLCASCVVSWMQRASANTCPVCKQSIEGFRAGNYWFPITYTEDQMLRERRRMLEGLPSQDVLGPERPNDEALVWEGDEVLGVQVVEGEFDDSRCEMCGKLGPFGTIMLCEGCNAGYHYWCVGLTELPPQSEEWFCELCICYEDMYNELP